MASGNHHKRSGLFLVRIWADEAEHGSGQVGCHGKVQRVVDGESHQFYAASDLLELLMVMLESHKSEARKDPMKE